MSRPHLNYNRLPDYTLKTRRLSAPALALRDTFKESRQPEQLLFVDLPRALKAAPFTEDERDPKNAAAFFSNWNKAMAELEGHYKALLVHLETLLCERIGVPDWEELRRRAATLGAVVSEPRLKFLA